MTIDLEKWQHQTYKISDMKPHGNNPRNITEKGLKHLKASLENVGYVDDIALFKDGTIAGGHARYLVMKSEGIKEVTVKICRDELSLEEQKEALVRLNKNIAGSWDFEILGNDFEFDDLLDWGWEKDDLLGEGVEVEEIETHSEEDTVPELTEDPITKRGDVWILGKHRLKCGDSTMIDDVDALVAGEKADMVFTSPPYNGGDNGKIVGTNSKVDHFYGEKGKDSLTSDDYLSMCRSALENCFVVTDGFIFWNVNYNSNSRFEFIEQVMGFKDHLNETICWYKSVAVANQYRLTRRWEPIFLFSNSDKKLDGVKGNSSNVWEITSGQQNIKGHSACFPVELPEKAMSLCGESFKSVFDPFSGSGTTLIACEKTNRKCFGMELDEKYCDVIIKRWQDYTKKEAILESTKETYNSML